MSPPNSDVGKRMRKRKFSGMFASDKGGGRGGKASSSAGGTNVYEEECVTILRAAIDLCERTGVAPNKRICPEVYMAVRETLQISQKEVSNILKTLYENLASGKTGGSAIVHKLSADLWEKKDATKKKKEDGRDDEDDNDEVGKDGSKEELLEKPEKRSKKKNKNKKRRKMYSKKNVDDDLCEDEDLMHQTSELVEDNCGDQEQETNEDVDDEKNGSKEDGVHGDEDHGHHETDDRGKGKGKGKVKGKVKGKGKGKGKSKGKGKDQDKDRDDNEEEQKGGLALFPNVADAATECLKDLDHHVPDVAVSLENTMKRANLHHARALEGLWHKCSAKKISLQIEHLKMKTEVLKFVQRENK